MKIRKSFISNSSSTSFCIVGLSGDDNDIGKQLGEDWESFIADSEEIKSFSQPDSDFYYIGVSIK